MSSDQTTAQGHTGHRIKGRWAGLRTRSLRSDWHRKRFKQQDGICAICGKPMIEPGQPGPPWKRSTLDHIIALSKGGSDHWENTQAVCEKCNREKGSE